jgi:hypothetical protein
MVRKPCVEMVAAVGFVTVELLGFVNACVISESVFEECNLLRAGTLALITFPCARSGAAEAI